MLYFNEGFDIKQLSLIFGFALTACSPTLPTSTSSTDSSVSASSAEEAEQDPPAAPQPDHKYSQREGDVYYYTGAISHDAADAGQAAPDIYAFRYLGENYVKGSDAVMALDSRGMSKGMVWCARPCKIIHMSDGQMTTYDPQSIIGSVFEDIANGMIEKPRVNYAPAYRADAPRATGPTDIYQPGSSEPDDKPSE